MESKQEWKPRRGYLTIQLNGGGISPFKFKVCKKCMFRYRCFFSDLPTDFSKPELKDIGRVYINIPNIGLYAIGDGAAPIMNDFTKYLVGYGCDAAPSKIIREAIKIREKSNGDMG